jgi:hypothetical protein
MGKGKIATENTKEHEGSRVEGRWFKMENVEIKKNPNFRELGFGGTR